MASSEKNRIVVLSVFILALIVFGLLYRPVDAVSRPAQSKVALTGK